MSARTIRRAIERKIRKQASRETAAALDQSRIDALTSGEAVAPNPAVSSAQLAANRQNSLQSTGPKSLEGKTRASLNAVKTGLTGNTVLLPSDNATQYELHLHRFTTQFKPLGDRENELVQSLANTQWRINRIPSLETGIYALARIEFAEKFAAYDPAEAAALIQAQAFITYHKQLNNRTVQEARLRRQYAKDSAELARVQAERVEQELKQPRSAPLPQPVFEPENLHDTENGFEYSSASLHALEDHLNLDPGGLGLPKAA